MTDVQILTLAIAVAVPVSVVIYSNSRLTALKETLRADMKALHVQMTARFTAIDTLLQTIMGKLDDMDRPLTALKRRR
jgi:hypothetical protein